MVHRGDRIVIGQCHYQHYCRERVFHLIQRVQYTSAAVQAVNSDASGPAMSIISHIPNILAACDAPIGLPTREAHIRGKVDSHGLSRPPFLHSIYMMRFTPGSATRRRGADLSRSQQPILEWFRRGATRCSCGPGARSSAMTAVGPRADVRALEPPSEGPLPFALSPARPG